MKQKDMETLKFKTNINCGGCIKAVTPALNNAEGISNWQVDTNNPEKILTVETEDLSANQVKEVVEKAGFIAQEIQ
jgi:copper chaperone CopZ